MLVLGEPNVESPAGCTRVSTAVLLFNSTDCEAEVDS